MELGTLIKSKADGIASLVNWLMLDFLEVVFRSPTGPRYLSVLHTFRIGSATTPILIQRVRGSMTWSEETGAQAGDVFYWSHLQLKMNAAKLHLAVYHHGL